MKVESGGVDNCISPTDAVAEARHRYNNEAEDDDDRPEVDAEYWNRKFRYGETQRYDWKRYEVTYYEQSEKETEVELSKAEYSESKENKTTTNPFETDTVTKYDNTSLNFCTECDGDGISDCETCGGNGKMECPDTNCDGGQIIVSCGCYGGEIEGNCPHCNGTGNEYYKGSKINCTECNGRGTVGKMCPDCKGKGTQNKGQCNLCSNKPPFDTLGIINCEDCSPPNHETTCNTCKGEGETYQATRVEQSYDKTTETVIEGDIPESMFERHSNCVMIKEYETSEPPYTEGLSDSAEEAKEFRVIEQKLRGYKLPYQFEDAEGELVVISDKVYKDIPSIRAKDSTTSEITFGALFILWLLGWIPVFREQQISGAAPSLEGIFRAFLPHIYLFIVPPVLFLIWMALIRLPFMTKREFDTIDKGFRRY